MGLWIIQNIKKELNDKYSFKDLCYMASKSNNKSVIINVNDKSFLSPDSMIETIKDYCKSKLNHNIKSIDELINIFYNGLVKCYIDTINNIEKLLNKKMKVFSGPTESTAIRNIVSQMLNKKIFLSVKEARKCIFESFDIKIIYVWRNKLMSRYDEAKKIYSKLDIDTNKALKTLQDIDKAFSMIPGKHKLNLHSNYAIFENGEFADRDKL